jgi:hypothetical protein
MKVPVNTSKGAEAKVVEILPQLGCRNPGKKGGKILFQNETRAPRTHWKMGGKIILSRIGDNKSEIAWENEPECHFVQKTGQKNGGRMRH